jgi:RNA polymerase sigma factor (sigma-70 family)
LSDAALRTLLIEDTDRGWRTFIDQYTPALLRSIERAGIRDRDEAMELYVLVCDRLAADDCARLRRHDSSKGTLVAWLAVLVRNTTIDWIRSRAGRRRIFGSIKSLRPLDQRVFELYCWEHRNATDIAGLLATEFPSLSLADVLDALERVQTALTDRQRLELVAMASRSSTPISLDQPIDDDDRPFDAPDPSGDIEQSFEARELEGQLERALSALPAEDAAIVRLKYGEGFSVKQIREALHLPQLTEHRVHQILETLKGQLQRAER